MLFLCFAALIAASIACSIVGFAASYYTIRVEYQFSDGSDAHDPYVAVLPKDSEDVYLTVKNPIIPGYKPVEADEFGEPGTVDAPTTILSYDLLTEDKTVTVYYVPDLVHYKVRYFMQNIQDDLYTEDLSLSAGYYEKSGYTGSYPTVLEEVSFPGFTNLFHIPDVIAADGSTVFQLYYDRNYYLVDFLLGEGAYGVEPVYAKHGTAFNIAEPKRTGYEFVGWVESNASGDYLEDGSAVTEERAREIAEKFTNGVVPIGGCYYRAVWRPEHVKFNVVYWSENPGDDGYSVIAEREITQIVVNDAPVDVEADMTVTPDTYIRNNADTQNIRIKDFFGLNLNYADPDNSKNSSSDPEYDPDIRYDSEDNIIDINDISKGVTEEYKGNGKLFELNTADNMAPGSQYITDTSVTVAGDGTTDLNVYFKRRPITLKFFYARVNNSTGAIDLTNSTKNFSNQSYSGMNYMSAVSRGTWQSDIADTLPTLKQEYVDAGYISQQTEVYSGYTYYYYQVETKYNAPLKNKWFVDSVNSVSKKGDYAESEICVPGSWAVENGTRYYYSHTSIKNYTIKGIYEKLGLELMFRDRTSDYTELHYLVSWTNTSTSKNWNYGINRVLRFKYKNYVEITNYEKNVLRSGFGMTIDKPDREIPSSRIYDPTKEDYIREPGTGAYIDLELVDDNELVSGSNAPYLEIVKFNTSTTPGAQPKLYGLKNTFEEIDSEVFDVDTVDSGDQYDRTKTEAVRTANVRANQTPTDLTGYQIENYRLDAKGQIVLDTTNTTVDWSEDTDTERHATIRFFYRRRNYNLAFRNGNDFLGESFSVHYGEYVNYTTSPQRLLTPAYYNADLKDYYSFNGWYFDPTFSDAEATAGFAMPSDDIILYAKWNPVAFDVDFYNDYGAYSEGDSPVHSCSVAYNEKILTSDVPVNEELAAIRLTPPSASARFAGWYYLDMTGNAVRFDPENLPVKQELELYAEWISDETAEYRVRYVEKGTDTEVADPDTGTIFLSKTKTFSAKTTEQYNEDHRWVEGQPNWWPVVSSHSLLIEANEEGEQYAPNEYTFEYVHKTDPVNYAVQYLDAETKTPIQDSANKTTYYAAVTETAPYIEGYVADSVTKARVLSASEKTGAAAVEEELRNNVIIFFFTASDTTAVYQVNHYVQNVDSVGYSLYNTDTLYGTIDESVSVSTITSGAIASGLTASGFTCDHATVSVDGAAATEAGESVTLTGAPIVISVYYNRGSYGYTVKYVDYDQEKLYDGDDSLWNGELYTVTYTGGDKQLLGTDVEISAPTSYAYSVDEDTVNYTRISSSNPILTIRYEDSEVPKMNVIKVYYKKDTERQLNYRIVCDRETSDTFAVLSQSTEIVANAGEINGSTVTELALDDHAYEFLGWFSTPEADEEDRLTTSSVHHYQPDALPGADATYYAVFHQVTVAADIEVRYNDSGVYTDDFTATEDTDGSVTGYVAAFTSPDGYVSGTQTTLDHTAAFTFDVTNPDGKMYPYEFAGWYIVDGESISEYVPDPEADGISVPRDESCRYIAMFRKRTSVSYEIRYHFTTRAHGEQDYIVKGTLSEEEIAEALNDSDACELTNAFVLSRAPYESNYGETLSWSDTRITRNSTEDGIVTVVTAIQNAKTVYANYRLSPAGEYTPIPTTIGANRHTDSKLEAIDARELTLEDKTFSYWEIRKTSGGAVIAKDYNPWFSFCMMDSYYISPVFNGEATPDSTGITLTHLDYSRNRWTDENGDIAASGVTDLLYTDFEIAFEDGVNQIYGAGSGYRAGVVFELCGKLGSSAVFNPSRDYGYYSDPDALKAAIKARATTYTTQNKEDSPATKRRSIQCSEIDTENISNKNRIEFAQYYPNAYTLVNGEKNYTNSIYLMKATAYLVKGEDVTLSNSVYICFKTEAAKELAIPPTEPAGD